jgi:hypothetical protein
MDSDIVSRHRKKDIHEVRIDWQLKWIGWIDCYSLRNTRLLAFEWDRQIDL